MLDGSGALRAVAFTVLVHVRSQTKEELLTTFQEWGERSFRVTQLLEWLYARKGDAWSQMTNLPAPLRAKLGATYEIRSLELLRKQGSRDVTQKFLWKLDDASLIEFVARRAYGKTPVPDGADVKVIHMMAGG